MSNPRKITVISLFLSAILLLATVAVAGQAATVTHLSGPLAARKADGSTKAISIGSRIEEGDTVVTEKRTYARLKFTDGSEVTLKPGSQFKVEKFSYDQGKPANDSATFSLIKGGLRSITGQVGKRGNQDSYQMKTPTATIGIRGTIYIAEYVPETGPAVSEQGRVSLAALDPGLITGNPVMTDAAPVGIAPVKTPSPLLLADSSSGGIGGRAPGLYVSVIDGVINLSNRGGSQNFSAGQFGYTASFTRPPVIVPSNPGIQFTPPPAFSSSAGPQGGSGGSSGSGKQGGGDCEVR